MNIKLDFWSAKESFISKKQISHSKYVHTCTMTKFVHLCNGKKKFLGDYTWEIMHEIHVTNACFIVSTKYMYYFNYKQKV